MSPLTMFLMKSGKAGKGIAEAAGAGAGMVGKGMAHMTDKVAKHAPESVEKALGNASEFMDKHSKLTGAAAIGGAAVGHHAMVDHGDEEEHEHSVGGEEESEYERMMREKKGY